MERCAWMVVLVLFSLTAGCRGGVNQVVSDHAQQDAVRKAEKSQAAERRIALAGDVRVAVGARLGMQDEAAGQLVVTIIGEQERLSGVKDPSTGLCVVMGLKDDSWSVMMMGTTLDPHVGSAMGRPYIEGTTVGDQNNLSLLHEWIAENCAATVPTKDAAAE